MRQLTRYALVGAISNLTGYVAYLVLTWLSVGPKIAMTIVYVTGASVGYLGNRQWTFSHKGKISTTMLRYGLAHVFGYALNFFILYIFVDRLYFHHQAVQAAAIFFVAGFLFVAFKTFVFPQR
jgi:putative flippase GtrA